MAEKSKIAWTESTFNPWLGCTKVSPGCQHCYAETLAGRYKWPVWGPTAARRITSVGYWKQPLRWNKLAGEAGAFWPVFCGSLCDIGEDRPELEDARYRLRALITATPNLTWLLLTKRPQSYARFYPELWTSEWPHVWTGASAENQEWLEKRWDALVTLPSKIRFLSIEPMLGPIHNLPEIEWVICGGESGKEHRPFDLDWARDLRDLCRSRGIAFFMKQLGGYPDKGTQLADLPVDLQIREWPDV